MTPAPRFECANLAMNINQSLVGGSLLHYWVRLPVTYPGHNHVAVVSTIPGDAPTAATFPDSVPRQGVKAATEHQRELSTQTTNTLLDATVAPPLASHPKLDPWEAWNTLRTLTEYNPQVSVVLEVTETLPSAAVQAKWLGEPVKAAILPTSIFVNNKKGYPTLRKEHQHFVQQMFLHKVQFVLTGRNRSPLAAVNPWKVYHQYLQHLVSNIPSLTDKDEFERPYYDYLQVRLTPSLPAYNCSHTIKSNVHFFLAGAFTTTDGQPGIPNLRGV
jgi:hypothetical protein